ncbi:MAG TPA: cysteine dioxygenase family protein [Candidatus Limnocylindrales bacterium]|nr:cysteine dioxygenase family protein [Candidatus Limnocylindrales bacterium]
MGALEVFTATLERIVRTGARPHEIVHQTREPLARLIVSPGWLDPGKTNQSEPAARLVAKADDDAWSVVCVVFPAGATTPVHDHLIWGLVGVYDGIEEETVYKRLDDGSRPGHAKLAKVGVQRNSRGAISLVIPPEQDIHSIRNPDVTPSVSIHVYGGDLAGTPRHRYDPDNDAVYDYQGEYAKDGA